MTDGHPRMKTEVPSSEAQRRLRAAKIVRRAMELCEQHKAEFTAKGDILSAIITTNNQSSVEIQFRRTYGMTWQEALNSA